MVTSSMGRKYGLIHSVVMDGTFGGKKLSSFNYMLSVIRYWVSRRDIKEVVIV